jgi:two-component system chemotaxis sensor kinase CheA
LVEYGTERIKITTIENDGSMSNKKQHIEELGSIVKSLADVWPNDRENVMTAGAKFEETIGDLDVVGNQLNRLIDLAWEGLKHLYEKDDYFMAVKAATMQAVNIVREYLLKDGDIPVEDFERACKQLEDAVTGDGESADKLIDEDEVKDLQDKSKQSANSKENEVSGITLDDLASFIMSINEEDLENVEVSKLAEGIRYLHKEVSADAQKHLSDVLDKIDVPVDELEEDWFTVLSEKTELAILANSDLEWQEEQLQSENETQSESSPENDQKTEIKGVADESVFTISEDADVGMLGEFVTECADLVDEAESALLDLEQNPNDDELINTIFRAFHTVKGTSAFMGLDPISDFTHSVETLLSMVREDDLSFDQATADITLESVDMLKKMLGVVEVSSGGDPLNTPHGYDRMMEILGFICEEELKPAEAIEKAGGFETAVATIESEKSSSEDAEKEFQTENTNQKQEAEASVRVNVGRLDRLIDMVGELVIAHSVVAQDRSIEQNAELTKKVNHTTKILRELQDTSLTLRMVPLKATFHKMNRLVRDLTRKADKDVKFSTVGEDTEIDRNMVDIISEPLVHMLRNSIDHGIETKEERAASSKSKTANVWLRAYQEGGKVVIEIEDDGKGIDKEKVYSKAVEKGLIDPEAKLTDSEIFSLIFLPGFSSIDEVTDLSGRGVGMDVVRRSIEELQGKVEVKSEKGKGTKISIELPFTLAITDGMLVRVGDQRFIIPTINIDMTFRAIEDELYTVMGDSEQVNFRGKSVPVIRLHKLFNIDGGIEDLLEGTMLVIKNNNKRYALLVDEVIGQQQLVGKSININIKMPHISGGAILGDGRVGLILDTTAVVGIS